MDESRVLELERKVATLEIQQSRYEVREENLQKSITRLEDAIKEYGDVIKVLQEVVIETKYMRSDLNKSLTRLETLENQKDKDKSEDAESWKKFKWLILTTIVTILVGFIAVTLGLK